MIKITNKRSHSLLFALEKGISPLSKLLLRDTDVDVNIRNKKGLTPLMMASEQGDVDLVQTLLNKGADIDTLDLAGNSALLMATAAQKVAVVELLLNSHANLNQVNNLGATPLMAAAQNGNEELLKLLLQNGAQVNAQITTGAFKGFTALMFAVDRAHYVPLIQASTKTVVDSLVKVSMIFKRSPGPQNPLSERPIQALLEYQAALELTTCQRDTALLIAVRADYKEGVTLLLKAGARFTHSNAKNEDAWNLASESVEMQKVLSDMTGKIFTKRGVEYWG